MPVRREPREPRPDPRLQPRDPETGRFITQEAFDKMNKSNQKRDEAVTKAVEGIVDEMHSIGKNIGEGMKDFQERSKKLAKLNKDLIKENAEYFNKKAEKFMDQAHELNAMDELQEIPKILQSKLQKMADISDEASTANFARLKELKNESITNLQNLEIMSKTDDSDELKELLKISREQVKLLKSETGLGDEIGNTISHVMKKGLGAIVGVAANSPLAAIGIDQIQNYYDKKSQMDADRVKEQIKTIKEQREDLIKDTKQMTNEYDEEALGDKIIEAFDKAVLELVPENATDDERDEAILQVVTKLGELSNISEDQKDMLSSWLSGSEEERREALDREKDKLEVFKSMEDALSQLVEQKEKEENAKGKFTLEGMARKWGYMLMSAIGAVFTGLFKMLGALPKMIAKFLFKGIPKLLARFFPLTLIVGTLFSGISDAIDEWRKTGSITKAIIAGLAGVLDFITFGLLNEETGKKIFNAIWETFTMLGSELAKMLGFEGQGFTGVVSGLFEMLKDTVLEMVDDFIADFNNIANFIAELPFVQNIMDAIGPIIDIFVAGWKAIEEPVNAMWETVKSKWVGVRDAIFGMFDWLKEVFSLDNLKKLVPDFIADRIFDPSEEEMQQMDGVERAKRQDVIDRDLVGNSEILDRKAIENDFSAMQVRHLIDLDDWNDDDEKFLRELWAKKLREETDNKAVPFTPEVNVKVPEQETPQAEVIIPKNEEEREQLKVAEYTQQPSKEASDLAAYEPRPKNVEMTKGDSQAQKVEASIVQLEKAQKLRQEREQKEQRRADAEASKATINQNNISNQTNNTSIQMDKPFNTDPTFVRSEDRNFAS